MKKNLTDLLKALRNGKLPSKHFQQGDVFIFEGNEPAIQLQHVESNKVILTLPRSLPVCVTFTFLHTRKFEARVMTTERVYLHGSYQCPIKAGKAVNALLKTL